MNSKVLKPILFFIFLITGLAFCYKVIIFNHFLVPIGDDSYPHILITQSFLLKGLFGMDRGYPPLFHIAMGLLSKLTGASLPTTFVWATPSLLFFAGISLGVFARLWQKSWLSFIVVFGLSIFVAQLPFQTWQDGGFPNVLASAIFLPIGMWFLAKATTDTQFAIKPILGYCAVLLLILLTHHLTTGTFILLSLGYLFSLIIYSALIKQSITINTKLIFGILIASIPIGLLLIPGQPVIALAKNIIYFSGTFPFIHSLVGLDNQDAIVLLKFIPQSLNWVIGWVGLAGLFWLWQDRKQSIEIKILFTSWIVILLILSQISALRFPARFSREIAIPATLLSGYFLISIFQIKVNTIQRLAIGFFVCLIVFTGVNIKRKSVSALSNFLEFTQLDSQAANYLKANLRPQECIIVAPKNRYYQFFLPSTTKIKLYEYDLDIRIFFNTIDQPNSVQWFQQCPYIVFDHLINGPDWTEQFEKAGFIQVVQLDDGLRGVSIFKTRNEINSIKD